MKKLNNKILILTLVALVGLFVLVRLFRTPALESNLKASLVTVDTSKVSEIKLWPSSEGGSEIQFLKTGGKWSLKKGDRLYNPDQGVTSSMLSYLVKLAPQKMVTRKKEKWNDYQVGDSSTHVQLLADGDVVADVRIGKLGFNQNQMQQQQQNFAQGGFDGAFTYVRLDGEDEVYTVDGFLESSFNRSLNDLRSKALLRIKRDQVTKVSFHYPDSGFVVELKDKNWWIAGQPADSNKIKFYLGQLEYKNASSFADDFSPTRQPDINLNMDGTVGPLATLQAWKREKDWVVTSTQQPGVYFSSEGSGIFNSVFERKKNLQLSTAK